MKKEKIKEDEQITVKEEINNEDSNLDEIVFKTEVKTGEITEEDPFSDTNNSMDQDPLEVDM